MNCQQRQLIANKVELFKSIVTQLGFQIIESGSACMFTIINENDHMYEILISIQTLISRDKILYTFDQFIDMEYRNRYSAIDLLVSNMRNMIGG